MLVALACVLAVLMEGPGRVVLTIEIRVPVDSTVTVTPPPTRPPTRPTPPTKPTPGPGPRPEPPATSPPSVDPRPDPAVSAVLAKHCASCHTLPNPAAGIALFNQEKKLLVVAPIDKLLIDQTTYGGLEPPGGPPLSHEEYSTVRAWIDDDRPAIIAGLNAAKARARRP